MVASQSMQSIIYVITMYTSKCAIGMLPLMAKFFHAKEWLEPLKIPSVVVTRESVQVSHSPIEEVPCILIPCRINKGAPMLLNFIMKILQQPSHVDN